MQKRRLSGFTLVELSVVLVVVGLVTGMGLVATLGALESAKNAATKSRMDEIEKALMAYRASNNRLPCPAKIGIPQSNASFGIEHEAPGYCTQVDVSPYAFIDWDPDPTDAKSPSIVEGMVPVRTLNLPLEYAYDGWGRRITYTVMAAYTSNNSFRGMHPKEQCGASVFASSDTDNVRSSNAVYTLISSGANGHGGFLSNGTRMSAASQNQAEQYNCRCNASATMTSLTGSVQQEFQSDPTNTKNTFDDIVRYKERWQMQTYDDDRNFGTYHAVQAVIGFTYGGASGSVAVYRKQCDNLIYVNDEGTPKGGNSVTNTFITPDNKYLFVYSSAFNCELYAIDDNATSDGDFVSNTSVWLAGYNCPAYEAQNVGAMAKSGHAIMTYKTAPYVRMWKYSAPAFNPLPITFNVALAAQPTKVAISDDGKYLAFSDQGGYVAIYRMTADNKLTLLETLTSEMPKNSSSMAFSKDGRFLAVHADDDDPNNLKIWRYDVTTSTFTAIQPLDADGNKVHIGENLASLIGAIAFSPDGQYLAVAGKNYKSDINADISIYKIDNNSDVSTNTFTYIPITNTERGDLYGNNFDFYGYSPSGGVVGMDFTPDSSYLIVAAGDASQYAVANIKKQDTLTFTYHGGVDKLSTGGTPASLAIFH